MSKKFTEDSDAAFAKMWDSYLQDYLADAYDEDSKFHQQMIADPKAVLKAKVAQMVMDGKHPPKSERKATQASVVRHSDWFLERAEKQARGKPVKGRWASVSIAILRSMRKEGKSWEEIGARLGRSGASARHVDYRMRKGMITLSDMRKVERRAAEKKRAVKANKRRGKK